MPTAKLTLNSIPPTLSAALLFAAEKRYSYASYGAEGVPPLPLAMQLLLGLTDLDSVELETRADISHLRDHMWQHVAGFCSDAPNAFLVPPDLHQYSSLDVALPRLGKQLKPLSRLQDFRALSDLRLCDMHHVGQLRTKLFGAVCIVDAVVRDARRSFLDQNPAVLKWIDALSDKSPESCVTHPLYPQFDLEREQLADQIRKGALPIRAGINALKARATRKPSKTRGGVDKAAGSSGSDLRELLKVETANAPEFEAAAVARITRSLVAIPSNHRSLPVAPFRLLRFLSETIVPREWSKAAGMDNWTSMQQWVQSGERTADAPVGEYFTRAFSTFIGERGDEPWLPADLPRARLAQLVPGVDTRWKWVRVLDERFGKDSAQLSYHDVLSIPGASPAKLLHFLAIIDVGMRELRRAWLTHNGLKVAKAPTVPAAVWPFVSAGEVPLVTLTAEAAEVAPAETPADPAAQGIQAPRQMETPAAVAHAVQELPQLQRLLSPKDLGFILDLSEAHIYRLNSEEPDELPPRFPMPGRGSRQLRWRPVDVATWMDKRVTRQKK